MTPSDPATAARYAERAAHAIAGRKLRDAWNTRSFPPIRPGCLRIFAAMPLGRIVTVAGLRAQFGGAPNDIREDLELLAWALLVHAPCLVVMRRFRPVGSRSRSRGGSTSYHYILLAA